MDTNKHESNCRAGASPADHAFTQAEPYTPDRVVAAQAMGLKYPNISQDSVETFNKTGIYPGVLQDVLIVLWLCSITDEMSEDGKTVILSADKQILRAMRSPDEAISKSISWGADNRITDPHPANQSWNSAYDKFCEIMLQINASRGTPQLPDNPPDDDEDDPKE